MLAVRGKKFPFPSHFPPLGWRLEVQLLMASPMSHKCFTCFAASPSSEQSVPACRERSHMLSETYPSARPTRSKQSVG